MTVKRDFKRRVRQRQVRTGESYVTARRHLMASRPAAPAEDDEPATLPGDVDRAAAAAVLPEPGAPRVEPVDASGAGDRGGSDEGGGADGGDDDGGDDDGGSGGVRTPAGISVVELVDVTDVAKQFGLLCGVLMYPALVERVAPARVLGKLREVLLATVDDPEIAQLTGLALTGRAPLRRERPSQGIGVDELRRFLHRARAGLSGTLGDGATLAFHVAVGDQMLPILCAASARGAIELSAIDALLPERWQPLGALLREEREPTSSVVELFIGALGRSVAAPVPLFLVYRGQRYPVMRVPFVIGRARTTADLVIDDSQISRKHAAVIVRSGTYYLKDVGSANGIHYKGMQIDNKRIDEGDVFQIGDHEIRFTFKVG
jgi:FHA domain